METGKYRRDPYSKAIINTDHDEYRKYIQQRNQAIQLQNVTKEVNALKKDIGDIKGMLQQLINGKVNG